ncbi:MAG: hypothetical protein AABZ55_10650 [Bdellovibrionota bacterium]
MSVIRGKIFIDREVVPNEVTIGGDWPYQRDHSGTWVTDNKLDKISISTLEQLLEQNKVSSQEDEEEAKTG